MRCCDDTNHGARARSLIVVRWRAGPRIQEALDLNELDLDRRRGSKAACGLLRPRTSAELRCDAMRAVFAVGCVGFPYDVFALFTSQHEAQRHADGAAYVFSVFAVPVYEDHGEVPTALRPPWRYGTRWLERISDEVTLTADALRDGDIDVVQARAVVAVVDPEPPELGEVRLLFTNASAAARYLQESRDWAMPMRSEPMPVLDSYDDCPPGQRYNAPGPAFNQNVRPR
jgi:hypothetical protein